MKVLIDNVVFYIQQRGGVSVVWREIINRILKEKSIHVKFLEYGKTSNIFRTGLDIDNTKIINRNGWFFPIKRYLNPKYEFNERFIFHSSYYRTCQNKNAINITTVHDFTYEMFFPFLKRTLHGWQKRRAIRNSDYVVCVSENTKKDCLKYIKGLDESKVKVIYNGVSKRYYPIEDKMSLQLPFPHQSYVMFVGDRTHYKNFNLVVDFWKKSNYNLVIVGSPLNISEQALFDDLGPDKKYVLLTDIPNDRLNELYNGAFCLIYPSKYEGFGIPIIEAQKAGCPVIAYDASSIPEIMGYKELLLHELSENEIQKKIKYIEDENNRRELTKAGINYVQKFTWDNTYTQLIELYRKAYAEKRNC